MKTLQGFLEQNVEIFVFVVNQEHVFICLFIIPFFSSLSKISPVLGNPSVCNSWFKKMLRNDPLKRHKHR